MTDDIDAIVRGLSKAQREAIAALPSLRPANPVQWQSAITFGNSWRKAAKHRQAFHTLPGVVESTESRGETLWRLTKPLGIEVRDRIMAQKGGDV